MTVPTTGQIWPRARSGTPAGGTTILSGTASPTSADGVIGNYYLDTDDRILYGPKQDSTAVNGTPESVYGSVTPAGQVADIASSAGNDITITAAGNITGLRYYAQASTRTRTIRLWNAGGTQIAATSAFNDTGTGWTTIPITPVAVTAGTYRISIDANQGNIAREGHVARTSTSQSLGSAYLGAVGARPTSANGNDWFTDVVLVPVVTPPPWPVALKSVPPGGTTGQSLKKTSNADYAVGWVT